ncbi:MAG: PLP-dependent aminotransferase family protein [Alphaproteobacteria bacterium]|nr:PLP-dependent aminotransferase family protein [Alphaproteobacteria bacterium]
MQTGKQRSDRMIETLLTPGLNTESTSPLNEQLMALLQEAILKGHIRAGDRLPASRAMAARLAISRNTVLAAYDQLTAEGYLESRTGSGTFVSSDLPDAYMQAGTPEVAPTRAPKHTAEPGRPLAGMPALDQFPFNLWGRLSGSVWRRASTRELQHNDPAGYRSLREAIATYLQAARGVSATPDQIMITTGLQQGLRFVADSIIPQDRAIILEDPGYGGLRKTAMHLPHPVTYTGLDDHGAMVPQGDTEKGTDPNLGKDGSALTESAETGDQMGTTKCAPVCPNSPAPGLLLITPSRQYPLGHTMPLSRRLELLEWAKATGAYIVEDDYDSEFRYAGRPVQSLQGLDQHGSVIYGGSFSKSLFLSLRIGYLILPQAVAETVIRHRERTESFPPLGDQMVLTRFIEEGHFARHLRKLRALHKVRLDAFMAAAESHLASFFHFVATDAGLHVVAFADPRLAKVSDADLARAAHRAGVGAVPLSGTYVQAVKRMGLLFGFANIPEAEIDKRLEALRRNILEITGF